MTEQEYRAMTTDERLAYNTELLENNQPLDHLPDDVPREEIPEMFQDKTNNLWYQYNEELKVYDPMFEIPEDEELEIGIYSTERREYLESEKYPMFVKMLYSGTLNKHCNDLKKECIEMEEKLMEQMSKAEGITSELQKSDWMTYVQERENLRKRVREIVLNEMVYV